MNNQFKKLLLYPFLSILFISTVFALTMSTISPENTDYIPGSSQDLFNITFVDTIATNDCFVWLWNTTDFTRIIISGVSGKKSCEGLIDLSDTSKYPEGIFDFYFVVDGENFPALTENFTTNIDRTYPLITISAVHDGLTDNTIDYNGTCSDINLDTCVVKYDNGASNTTLPGIIGTTSSLPDGDYIFWTVGTDLAGNLKDEASPMLTIDAAPAAPTGLTIDSLTETSLFLDWDDNIEFDLVDYTVYGSVNAPGINISNPATYNMSINMTTSEYEHTGLTTGDTWYYVITAHDASSESNASLEVGALVMDLTAPMPPILNVLEGACDNINQYCNVTNNNATFNINYSLTETDNLNLTILSGATEVDRLFDNTEFDWGFYFLANGTYQFTFNATDAYGNYNETTYNMFVGGTNLTLMIADLIRLNYYPFTVKPTALSNGNDYVVLGFNLEMFGGDFIRLNMGDLVSLTSTILINEETTPLLFCENDYDTNTRDIVTSPTYNVYEVNNNYDLTQEALDCPDTNPTGVTSYKVYLKIPIPVGMDSGDYLTDFEFGLFDVII